MDGSELVGLVGYLGNGVQERLEHRGFALFALTNKRFSRILTPMLFESLKWRTAQDDSVHRVSACSKFE